MLWYMIKLAICTHEEEFTEATDSCVATLRNSSAVKGRLGCGSGIGLRLPRRRAISVSSGIFAMIHSMTKRKVRMKKCEDRTRSNIRDQYADIPR